MRSKDEGCFRDLARLIKLIYYSYYYLALELGNSGNKFVIMKHKKIFFSGLIMIVAAAAIMTIAQTSLAADTTNGINASSTSSQLKIKHNKLGAWLKKGMKPNPVSQADRAKKQAAVAAAIQANDYNAWVQAVGANSPMLTKINADNFPKFVQAHQLRKQADAIMTELGLNQGMKLGQLGTLNK